MKRIALIFLLTLVFSTAAQAENMIMQRVHQSFETTMILVKEKLDEYGYKVAHIQKCDGGLSDFGYKTDAYRSIFYGKFEEMRYLSNKYPMLIPYVPLKIAVIQEKDTVVLVAINPHQFADLFPQKELGIQFDRWESDIRAILEEVAQTPSL
jgi:uncharacterized protein (DUF302 family)